MPLHIASLGSSFAAGPGIAPIINKSAKRSGRNYAHIIAERRDARLTDLSVSGATLLNLLNEPQICSGKTYPPQIDELPESADVVLVLGGGNDIANWFGWSQAVLKGSGLDVDGLADRYGMVLDAIHVKAPQAVLLVVEYLTLFGSDVVSGVDVPFIGAVRLAHHCQLANMVRLATFRAVEKRRPWCSGVQVAEVSAANGIGSVEPWVHGWSWSLLFQTSAYHPNAAGMQAAADLIEHKLNEIGTTTRFYARSTLSSKI